MKIRYITQIEVTVDLPDVDDEDEAYAQSDVLADEYLQTLTGNGQNVSVFHVGMDGLQNSEVVE